MNEDVAYRIEAGLWLIVDDNTTVRLYSEPNSTAYMCEAPANFNVNTFVTKEAADAYILNNNLNYDTGIY